MSTIRIVRLVARLIYLSVTYRLDKRFSLSARATVCFNNFFGPEISCTIILLDHENIYLVGHADLWLLDSFSFYRLLITGILFTFSA